MRKRSFENILIHNYQLLFLFTSVFYTNVCYQTKSLRYACRSNVLYSQTSFFYTFGEVSQLTHVSYYFFIVNKPVCICKLRFTLACIYYVLCILSCASLLSTHRRNVDLRSKQCHCYLPTTLFISKKIELLIYLIYFLTLITRSTNVIPRIYYLHIFSVVYESLYSYFYLKLRIGSSVNYIITSLFHLLMSCYNFFINDELKT